MSEAVKKAEIVVNSINHLLIIFSCCYITWSCLRIGKKEPTSYHAWFCSWGFQLLFAEGIQAMYGRNVLLIHFPTSKAKRRTIHWSLQVCGAVFVLTGITIQIISRILLGKEHFGSIHSIFGLISAILLLFAISSGCAALFALKLRERIKPIFNKLFHVTVASVTFIGGMTTIILAYQTKPWLEQEDYGDFRTTMIYINSLITILTLIGALKNLWCHVRNIILGRCHYEVVP